MIKLKYRILRTVTQCDTGIQHIAYFCSAKDMDHAQATLYHFLANAIGCDCKITEVGKNGFSLSFGEIITWKFEIVEY